MRLESHEPARFDRSSPVLTHWLSHSEGFRVEGRSAKGVVEKVYGIPGVPKTVAVRTRFARRRLLLPAELFEEVVPAQRLLIVGEGLREEKAPQRARTRRPRATALRLAVRCSRALAWSADVLWHAARSGAVVTASILRDASLSLVELERMARPRLQRLASAFARVLARASRAIASQAAAARREAHVAQSLEKVIVALGREQAAGNGRVSEERRELTGTGSRRRRAQ